MSKDQRHPLDIAMFCLLHKYRIGSFAGDPFDRDGVERLGDLVRFTMEAFCDSRPDRQPAEYLADFFDLSFRLGAQCQALMGVDDSDPARLRAAIRWLGNFAGLHASMAGFLYVALSEEEKTPVRLVVRRRRPGKPPPDPMRRASKGRRAARRVRELVEAGWKQDAAIAEVSQDEKLSRSEIMAWMRDERLKDEWRQRVLADANDPAPQAAREIITDMELGTPFEAAMAGACRRSGLTQAEIEKWLPPRAELEAWAAKVSADGSEQSTE